MIEWLKSDPPLLIALISFAGLIISSLINSFGSRRDKATANTITELNTTIKRLGFDIDRLQKMYGEKEAAYESEKARHDIAQQLASRLEVELARLTEVVVSRHWIALVHDSLPRSPLCPVCHADGKIIHMCPVSLDEKGAVENWFQCPDRSHKTHYRIKPEEAELVFEFLGKPACYNPGPPQSSPPPRPSLKPRHSDDWV